MRPRLPRLQIHSGSGLISPVPSPRNSIVLRKILCNTDWRQVLEDEMKKQCAEESVRFWGALEATVQLTDPIERLRTARLVVCEYVLNHAPQQVNMSGIHLSNILRAFVSDDSRRLIDALVEAQESVFHDLSTQPAAIQIVAKAWSDGAISLVPFTFQTFT